MAPVLVLYSSSSNPLPSAPEVNRADTSSPSQTVFSSGFLVSEPATGVGSTLQLTVTYPEVAQCVPKRRVRISTPDKPVVEIFEAEV